MRRAIVAGTVLLLLLAGLPLGTADARTTGEADVTKVPSHDPPIDLVTTYEVDREGELVHVTATFSPESSTKHFFVKESSVHDGRYSDVSVSGFERTTYRGTPVYVWAGGPDPEVSFTLLAREFQSRETGGTYTAGYREVFPTAYLAATSDDVLQQGFSATGDAYGGNEFVMLSPASVETREVDGKQVTVAVAEAADARPEDDSAGLPDVDAVFDVYETIDGTIGTGRQPSEEHVFLDTGVENGHSGVASGTGPEGDIVVNVRGDDEDRMAGTLAHEMVHTRDTLHYTKRPQNAATFVEEAQADYVSHLRLYEAGYIDSGEFRAGIRDGFEDDAVLSEAPKRDWYVKGELVLAALDAKIREATDGEATLVDALARANRADSSSDLTTRRLMAHVEAVSGEDFTDWFERHTTTSAAPAPPESVAYVLDDPTADADEDGLAAEREIELGTHPFVADTDGDGLPDGEEADGPTSPRRPDSDGDGIGDAEDDEFDPPSARERTPTQGGEDESSDGDGSARDVDPRTVDRDNDGLSKFRERELGSSDDSLDSDGDGLRDSIEVEVGSDPAVKDTDGDGIPDGEEQASGADPGSIDADGDGATDWEELEAGTDLRKSDTDGDGLSDGQEIAYGFDATEPTPATYVEAVNRGESGSRMDGIVFRLVRLVGPLTEGPIRWLSS